MSWWWCSEHIYPIEMNITATLPSDKLPTPVCLCHDWLIKRSSHAWEDWDWPSSLVSNFRLEIAFQLHSFQWCTLIWTFITHPLVHIHQKMKIAPKIEVNGPLDYGGNGVKTYLKWSCFVIGFQKQKRSLFVTRFLERRFLLLLKSTNHEPG
jgi:hypothetical protein